MNALKGIRYQYDSPGKCPKCGSELVHVIYYRANRGESKNTGYNTVIIGNTKTITYTTETTYYNIQPMFGGFCEECKKNDFDKRQEKRQERYASKRPKPIFMIISAVILVLCFWMVSLLDIVLHASETLTTAICILLLVDIPVFLTALFTFIYKKKRYNKYKSGYRDEYIPSSQEYLSRCIADYMNRRAKGNIEYLDIEKKESLIYK